MKPTLPLEELVVIYAQWQVGSDSRTEEQGGQNNNGRHQS
jgi:hypothetical protein